MHKQKVNLTFRSHCRVLQEVICVRQSEEFEEEAVHAATDDLTWAQVHLLLFVELLPLNRRGQGSAVIQSYSYALSDTIHTYLHTYIHTYTYKEQRPYGTSKVT